MRGRNIRGGGAQSAENRGFVNYTVGDVEYVAVLGPDATVVRTIALPQGASGDTVFFGPDGVGYLLVGTPATNRGRGVCADTGHCRPADLRC